MSSLTSSAPEIVGANPTHGFPADYLLARIKGRRATLIADWDAPRARNLASRWSDEQIWEALLTELQWLHGQLNDRLQRVVPLVFGLFEIKTLVLCLRNKALQRDGPVAKLLERSLLEGRLKGIVASSPDLPSAVTALTQALGPQFSALSAAFAAENLKGFENGLMHAYLENVISRRLHPTVRTFFEQFIDVRNAMLRYKHRRWHMEASPRFIAGGSVPPSKLEDLFANGSGEISVETALLRNLTRTIEKMRREDDIGSIVAYIWRLYVQARNLAILHHATELEEGMLERELIR